MRTLRAEAQNLTEEQFAARHPDPALVLNVEPGVPVQAAGPEAWMKKTLSDEDGVELDDQTRQVSRASLQDPGLTPSPEVDLDAAAATGHVVFVRRGERSLFPDMITMGRVPNNDIVLGFPTVSKVHAYLKRKGDAWWVFDQRSKNGTFVQRTRLAPGGSAPLADGATISLGPSLALTFMVPTTLFGFMRGARLPRRG